jgi:hypothetical protein
MAMSLAEPARSPHPANCRVGTGVYPMPPAPEFPLRGHSPTRADIIRAVFEWLDRTVSYTFRTDRRGEPLAMTNILAKDE